MHARKFYLQTRRWAPKNIEWKATCTYILGLGHAWLMEVLNDRHSDHSKNKPHVGYMGSLRADAPAIPRICLRFIRLFILRVHYYHHHRTPAYHLSIMPFRLCQGIY